MESEAESNPSSCDPFLDAPDEFFYDCFSTHYDSEFLNSSPAENPQLRRFPMDTDSPSSSSKLDSFEKLSTVGNNNELSLGDLGTFDKKVDVTDSGMIKIDQFREKGEDFEVIDSSMDTDVTDSGQDRVDPFTATTFNDEQGEVYSRPEPTSTDWSMTGLVIRSIKFQISLMISFIKFPLWLIHSCLTFVFYPYRTMRRCRRYLVSKIVELCDFGLKDDKSMLEVVRKLVWGLVWAVYIGIMLLALLASAFMISSFVITYLAREPLVIKESLNFDYTKNSPEAYVPITSCAGIGRDSSCKESIQSSKIRGLKDRTEITVSMTLPESDYNRNLGMFQIRVDFLSASGQILASSRRPCMIRFRSEPIRLVQTFLKIAPLVTGYVSEIQTLKLKLKGFVDKDIIPTACLKIMIEQRAEFRPGVGIPEIYDASLLLESKLPFFKRIIWNWRRTLFVWISMSVFITELLLTLVCFRPLIIPRTGQRIQQRDGTHSINNNSNLDGQAGSR